MFRSDGGSGDGSTMRLHGVLPRIDITVYSSIDAEDQTASTFLTYMNHLSFDVTNNSAATTGTTAAGATAPAAAAHSAYPGAAPGATAGIAAERGESQRVFRHTLISLLWTRP